MVTSKKGQDTPAEQLLRMIEGAERPTDVAKLAPGSSLHQLSRAMEDVGAWLWRRMRPDRRGADQFLWNLRLAQRGLWLVLVGIGAYVVLDALLVHPGRRIARVTLPEAAPAAVSTAPHSSVRPLSEYLELMGRRNPFTGTVGGVGQPVVKTATSRLQELMSGLIVVGIDRGPNPVALIEDKATQKTYVVRIGDELSGMTVRRIDSNGVTVSYEGEEIVLP